MTTKTKSNKGLLVFTLAALGVVYGDIGTSPLYAINQIFFGHGQVPLTTPAILGSISLVFWALTIIITIKYVLLVLRADNRGSGGVFALLSLLSDAEQARRDRADELQTAENALTDADKALKLEEHRLAEMRENKVRSESAVEQAREAEASLTERIRERLECTPADVLPLAELDPSEPLPNKDTVDQKLQRLLRERENIGPVNLRAEVESNELDQQLAGMQTERSDLVNAIARLRQGINSLNREGRERLLAAFELVNGHFEKLFTRLFGGGRAHLALTEAEDPLEAGLEILASPPGKKLQVMSLLSGGEQALTALALLFAVFLVNPAPICVLDEVDAPLDDANVERFCNLVDELGRAGDTRFLVITHHRLTMARMDRLFGVTMSERGVSQLVSVDLQDAHELKAAQ